jgi:hypothetical protein
LGSCAIEKEGELLNIYIYIEKYVGLFIRSEIP